MKIGLIGIFFNLFALLNICYAGVSKDTLQKSKTTHNAFYVEGGGTALVYSLNYDRRISLNEKSFISCRLGASKPIDNSLGDFFIPVTVTYNIGTAGNYFETGVGTPIQIGNKTNESFYHGLIGYRRQMPYTSTLLRLNFLPFISTEGLFFIRLGGSIGICF